ncbi:class I adenylate-forming enzyme family protein [Candidatus Pelagibacter bacterium nBUS_25]|uniref:class I adenylate-forming enzyme family protein n=1 Tax=Candidatus Pelagibacter bacterium nBUS_25 TaxID=3374187 RepID=UPI003EBB2C4B
MKNLIDVLEKNSKGKKGDKTFIFYESKDYSFKDIVILINQTCNYFEKSNLKYGDRIVLILENSIEFVILYFASMKFGLIINLSPIYLSPSEASNNIKDIKPKLVFCSEKFNSLKNIKFFKKKIQIIKNKNFLNFIIKYKKEYKRKKINNEDIAVLYYSSGSTGKSKLIKMSHRAIYNSQKMQLDSPLMGSGDNHLCILPLAHTSSLRSTLKFCAFNHRTVYLYKNFWSIRGTILDIIEKYKITFIMTVPSILSMMNTIFSKDLNRLQKIKSLKFVACGSSYLSKDVADKFIDTFNVNIINIYGLSETCAISMTDYKDKKFTLNSVGKILKSIKFKIINKNNKLSKNNEAGELCVKTPAIYSGYINDKNQILNQQYFKTGDIFTRSDDGHLFFIERKKNIIIKSGINISAREIDTTILKSNRIADTFTTSTSDIFHGEVPISYIVPLKKNFDLSKLEVFCKKRLGEFKVPTIFKILKSIPRSPTGKIRFSLLERQN